MSQNYAFVVNGKIRFAGPLPRAHENVSGLDLMPDADLAKIGWFPLVEDDPNCADGETHDGPQIVFEPTRVRVIYLKRPLNAKEQAEKDYEDALKVAHLKNPSA